MDMIEQLRQALTPRYEALDEIGQGGSAVVFRATDTQHGRAVAIKALLPELWSRTGAERFLREIRVAAKLQHPNILPLFDSGEAEGLLYYVMPFVSGESLRSRIKRDGPLPIDDAIDIALDVSSGLSYAHGQGIIHRDIKPGNILLSEGRAVLADFGIARALQESPESRLTSHGFAPGTPTYMSPEHAGAEEVDARSDIYSLGCVLFETLVGEPPFTGRTVHAVVARHMHESPPSLTVVRPAISEPVADVVQKALSKVPADRFQTADELAVALRATAGATAGRRRPKHGATRSWLSYVALALLAMVAGVTLPRWFSNDPVLDENRIVVFPFVARGDAEVEAGWDVALAIGTALEQTEPLRWIDGWDWLPAEVRADPSLLTPDLSEAIAAARGAGRWLTGVIRPTADSTAVTIRLHNAESTEFISQATAWGAVGRPAYDIALGAIRRILPGLIEPGRTIDLTPLTDRAPAAVALTIQGDRSYRSSRFEEALDFYERAVAEDSLMAVAAARGARAASWLHRNQQAMELAKLATRHESLLPERHQRFVRGVLAYESGDADAAVHQLTEAALADPRWSEPAALLGETYYHLFPTGASARVDAERAFSDAVQRDSTFAPPLYHLIGMKIAAGDVRRAETLTARLERIVGSDDGSVRSFVRMAECVGGDADPTGWADEASQNPNGVLAGGLTMASAGAQPACAEQALRALLNRGGAWTWGALFSLQSLMLAEGRVEETVTLLDSMLATGFTAVYPLYAFDAGISGAFDEGARRSEEIARRAYGDLYRGAKGLNLWLLGTWWATQGDAETPRKLSEELERFVASPVVGREARLFADALAAHAALARGDDTAALDLLSKLRPNASPDRMFYEFHEALAPERIREARLLLEMERYQEALDMASAFDHPAPVSYLAYLAPSLGIRLRAAEALGRDDLASEYRERLRLLGWSDGDVPLSPTGPLLMFPSQRKESP
jgi:Protein kinase domain